MSQWLTETGIETKVTRRPVPKTYKGQVLKTHSNNTADRARLLDVRSYH